MNYMCRIATLDDMNKNWDYQINKANNKSNWIKWKYEIYQHWGFNDYIKSDVEVYPDGTKIDVNYYGKKLK